MKKLIWPVAYIAVIVTVNTMYGLNPWWNLAANVVVGLGFIVRDFAQRDIGDNVLFATLAGVIVSFVMADPGVAVPSAVAFAISETVDWGVVRRLHRAPMWKRVAVSHLFSVPLDSAIFLGGLVFGIGLPWSWAGFLTMTGMKFVALVVIWFFPSRALYAAMAGVLLFVATPARAADLPGGLKLTGYGRFLAVDDMTDTAGRFELLTVVLKPGFPVWASNYLWLDAPAARRTNGFLNCTTLGVDATKWMSVTAQYEHLYRFGQTKRVGLEFRF